jgi:hypothetical protein
MDLTRPLVEIEKQLWKNDAALYHQHLLEEAVLVFAETGVITKSAAVEAIEAENAEGRRWAEVRFYDARSLQVAADVAVLTYRVNARWEHERSKSTALASSMYVLRDGSWKLAFHQQTPIVAG